MNLGSAVPVDSANEAVSREPPLAVIVLFEFLPFVAPATSEFNRLDRALCALPVDTVRSSSPDRRGDVSPVANRLALSTAPGDSGVTDGEELP